MKLLSTVAATMLLIGAVSSANAQTCPIGYYFASDGQCYPTQSYAPPYAAPYAYAPYAGAALGAAALGAYGYRRGWYGNNRHHHGGSTVYHGDRGTVVHRNW